MKVLNLKNGVIQNSAFQTLARKPAFWDLKKKAHSG